METEARFKEVAYYCRHLLARKQSIYQPGAERVTDPEARDAKQKGLPLDARPFCIMVQ